MHTPPFFSPLALLAAPLLALSLLALPAAGGYAATPTAAASPSATPAASTGNASAGSTADGNETLAPLPADYQAANLALIEQTQKFKGRRVLLKNGEAVPPFALYDQNGQPVLVPTQWRGKYIVISFIFTRCKMPTMCPAATAKMAGLQRVLKKNGLEDKVQLLSISFDPEYDSPAVLRQYSRMFGIELSNYALLTGPSDVIQSLLRRFGVLTVAENNTINHTMSTVLVSPDGTLELRQSGPNWTGEAFLEKILAATASAPGNAATER